MDSKRMFGLLLPATLLFGSCGVQNEQTPWNAGSITELYRAAPNGVHSRWISPENPAGEKGKGGLTNKGAKGNAFYIVQPGESQTLFDVSGAGIINRMWLSGTIGVNAIQQMANANKIKIAEMKKSGANITPVWFLGKEGNKTVHRRLLDEENPPQVEDEDFPVTSTNFYRSDDVSATAYFYLDRPENNLPALPGPDLRTKDLTERVFQYRE